MYLSVSLVTQRARARAHTHTHTHTRARLYTDACTDIPTCTHSLLPPSKYMHRHCMPYDVADTFVLIPA